MINDTPEVVRIGSTKARITSVTPERLDYVDEREQACFIDLGQCAQNWVDYHRANKQDFISLSDAPVEKVDAWNSRCVGMREVSAKPPWVEFMNERRTRFEFVTDEEDAVYPYLLGPLGKAGWHTFDAG